MAMLGMSEIESARSALIELQSEVRNFREIVDSIVKSFEVNEVVKSLYESGKFGAETKQKIDKISFGVDKYCDTILNGSDGLINRTRDFLDQQESLNQNGGYHG